MSAENLQNHHSSIKSNYLTDIMELLSFPMYRSSRLDVFYEKGVLKNSAKFTGKHLYRSLFFKLKACNSIKKSFWKTCFLVSFVKTFGDTPIL